MEGFDKEVCRRLPLAEAALRMLDFERAWSRAQRQRSTESSKGAEERLFVLL